MSGTDAAARRAVLARSPLFQAMQPAEMEAVVAQATVKRVPRGAVLLRRGAESPGAFVVMQGQVRIATTAEDGREVTLGVLGPGDVIGEMSLIDGEPVSADATALDACVLMAIERGRFLRQLRTSPDLCLRLMAVLTRRLRRSNAALEEMALLPLPVRLGRVLLRLAKDYGAPVPGGTRIEVRLSQKDLAAIAGASREKVNRQLRLWEDAGAIGHDTGRITVLRPEVLEELPEEKT